MISVLPDQHCVLWDLQNEVEAEISVPASASLDGKDYMLVYLEDDFPDEENAQEEAEEEDGVCVLAVTEHKTPASLFELRNETGTVLGYAEEPPAALFERITGLLLSGLE